MQKINLFKKTFSKKIQNMTEMNFSQESAHDSSFSNLMKSADELRKDEAPVFLVDGSFEKNSAAVKFLKQFDFVIVKQAPESSFMRNCANLKKSNPLGHESFAFCFQKSSDLKENYFKNNFEPQLVELLEKEMTDFIPDATAHSQEAWNLRCDLTMRQLFSAIYNSEKDCSDELLPSIESPMQCDLADSKSAFTAPTMNYNPTWSRAPHVISAYHL